MSHIKPRLKYRRGLKIDPAAYKLIRDTYSLLDSSQLFDRSLCIPVSEEPFLIVREWFSHRQLTARAMMSPEGRKIFCIEWSEDGVDSMQYYPESFQWLVFHLDGSLQARAQHLLKQKKRQ